VKTEEKTSIVVWKEEEHTVVIICFTVYVVFRPVTGLGGGGGYFCRAHLTIVKRTVN
jgi:hypothetical protein